MIRMLNATLYSMTRAFCTFLWIVALAPSGSAAPSPKARTALVIGNARYENAVGGLRNSGNDARAVSRTLRNLGFSVIERHDVTRDQLLKAVLAFRATLPEAEVGLFYFAGHGISVAGANYLIPIKSGYIPDDTDDVALRMLAETRLFNVEQALAEMHSAGARCNLLILDACRTSNLGRPGRTRTLPRGGGLSEMNPPAGSLIAFAADAGQTAFDGDGANGLYTEELLKHLQTPGLTIEQVFKRTRAVVLERSGGGQIPAEYSRLVGEDVFLAGPARTEPTPPLSPPQPFELSARPASQLTLAEINRLAAAGKAAECIVALQAIAQTKGPGDYAAAPLETLLEGVKDDLKDATSASPKVVKAMTTCDLVLRSLPEALSPAHPSRSVLTAKAHNRRGDALLLLSRAEEALEAFNLAMPLAPDDAYILYNRGRAHVVLGRSEEARSDFTAASDPRFQQPTARKLAQQALEKLK